jgi:hypothetical protein
MQALPYIRVGYYVFVQETIGKPLAELLLRVDDLMSPDQLQYPLMHDIIGS